LLYALYTLPKFPIPTITSSSKSYILGLYNFDLEVFRGEGLAWFDSLT
jgi:hypothetical protein